MEFNNDSIHGIAFLRLLYVTTNIVMLIILVGVPFVFKTNILLGLILFSMTITYFLCVLVGILLPFKESTFYYDVKKIEEYINTNLLKYKENIINKMLLKYLCLKNPNIKSENDSRHYDKSMLPNDKSMLPIGYAFLVIFISTIVCMISPSLAFISFFICTPIAVIYSKLYYKYTLVFVESRNKKQEEDIMKIVITNENIYIDDNLTVKNSKNILENVKITVSKEFEIVIKELCLGCDNIVIKQKYSSLPNIPDTCYITRTINNHTTMYKEHIDYNNQYTLLSILEKIFKICNMDDYLKEIKSRYEKLQTIVNTDKTFNDLLINE